MSKKKHKNPMRTDLSGHRQVGKKFLPPFAQLPKVSSSSWLHQRIPDMLWAVVLVGHLDRSRALSAFRRVAKSIHDSPDPSLYGDVRLTALAQLDTEKAAPILNALIQDSACLDLLKSVLVLEGLPGKTVWASLLEAKLSDDESWNLLMQAVGKVLWHQSQEATDCRWMRLLAMIMAGQIKLPNEELVKEMIYYPDYGDQKKVRPSIRAAEISFNSSSGDTASTTWADVFWLECLRRTPCFTLLPKSEVPDIDAGTTIPRLTEVWNALGDHFMSTLTTTAPDAKHDAIFGLAFYSLAVLRELLSLGNSQLVLSRLGLRTLLECCVTLKYLIVKESATLWETYRVYGSGQAKLAYLKLKNLDEPPRYISLDDLDALINEDVWDEFLQIDVGHWENSNLRKLSVEGMAKELYDHYYPWTSTFVHAHWGAIRDSVFDTCVNPLHRLHRVPRRTCRSLPDVVSDACKITDETLACVDSCYKPFPCRVTVKR